MGICWPGYTQTSSAFCWFLGLHALTYVVGPDLERLVLAHEQADLLVLFVLQQLYDPQAALFPLIAGPIIPVQLAFPARGKQHAQ